MNKNMKIKEMKTMNPARATLRRGIGCLALSVLPAGSMWVASKLDPEFNHAHLSSVAETCRSGLAAKRAWRQQQILEIDQSLVVDGAQESVSSNAVEADKLIQLAERRRAEVEAEYGRVDARLQTAESNLKNNELLWTLAATISTTLLVVGILFTSIGCSEARMPDPKPKPREVPL